MTFRMLLKTISFLFQEVIIIQRLLKLFFETFITCIIGHLLDYFLLNEKHVHSELVGPGP